jgi:hypothetical protein
MKRIYDHSNDNSLSSTSTSSSIKPNKVNILNLPPSIKPNKNVFNGKKYVNFEDERTVPVTDEDSSSVYIDDVAMEKLVKKRQQVPISSYSSNLLEPFAVEEEYNSLPDSSIAKQRRKVYEKNISLYNQFREQNILLVQEIEIPYSDPMKYISSEDRDLMFRNSIIQTFILNFQPFVTNERNKFGVSEDSNNIWSSDIDCRYTWTSSEHMKKFMEMFDCEFTGKLMPVNNHQRVKVIFNFNIIDTMTEFNDKTVFVTIVIDVITSSSGLDHKSKLFQFVTYFFNICKNEINIMS